jgi:hypothetical protein
LLLEQALPEFVSGTYSPRTLKLILSRATALGPIPCRRH